MEIWKSIENYNGFYEVSNMGRIRSVNRTVYFKNGKGKRDYIGKILRVRYRNGYAIVNLNKNKECKTFQVHQLVARHFIPNPNGYPIINHKDGIKSNNKVENLEWCDYKYNNHHAIENHLTEINIEGILQSNKEHRISVVCVKDLKILHFSDCSRSMARWLIDEKIIKGISFNTVARAIRNYSNINKSYHGYQFIRVPKNISLKDAIVIIDSYRVIAILQTSKDCATWLLQNNYIENASIETVSRNIRKSINKKPYHNFIFQKVQ